jgi:hypothetical protein
MESSKNSASANKIFCTTDGTKDISMKHSRGSNLFMNYIYEEKNFKRFLKSRKSRI